MGAWLAERTATGKSADEAFRLAVQAAQDEVGHQEGYSGDINSGGYGFIEYSLPARFTYAKLQALLEEYEFDGNIDYLRDNVRAWRPGGFWNPTGKKRGWKGNLRKAERELAKVIRDRERLIARAEKAGISEDDLETLSRIYADKWGEYICVELRGAEAKGYSRKRGEKVYRFFGYAPC